MEFRRQRIISARLPRRVGIVAAVCLLLSPSSITAHAAADDGNPQSAQAAGKARSAFAEPDFWHNYKWQIAVVATVCALQAILLAGLIVQRKRRTLEEQRSRHELQELTGRLLVAQESERKRIARELHDDIGQTLALLSVEMDLLHQGSDQADQQLTLRIEAISARVKQLSTSIHELSHQLHPIKLEQLGLVTALRGLCSELSQTHGLSITFSHDELPLVAAETSLCIFRVAQEALSNAIRHGKAANISVDMNTDDQAIHLQIADDGIGFDPDDAANHEGLGLVSIRERLRACDGSLTIDAKPGYGTRLRIVIPLTNGTNIFENS